jgi:uncharacterized membrane protein
MSTNRLEAFSDGVIAVAITLLVLDITVPGVRHGSLGHNLLDNWRHYAAYATSFITIGIIWINHHVMVGRLREADHAILGLNLLLLLTIAVLPFTTSLMAEYVTQSSSGKLAAAVYSGAFLVMSVAFSVLNRHILLDKEHLLDPRLPEALRRRILARALTGLIPYAIATAAAFVTPYATLVICGAVAAFYALPIASGVGLEADVSR